MLVPWQLKQLAFQIWRRSCAPSGIGVISFQSIHRLAGDVPEHRQHIDASVGQRRQVALVALGAERVVHGEGFRRAAAERDRRRTACRPSCRRCTSDRDRRTSCLRGSRRPRWLRRPAWSSGCGGSSSTAVLDVVTARARRGSQVVRSTVVEAGGGATGAEIAGVEAACGQRRAGAGRRRVVTSGSPEDRDRSQQDGARLHRGVKITKKGPINMGPSSQRPSQPGSKPGCTPVGVPSRFNRHSTVYSNRRADRPGSPRCKFVRDFTRSERSARRNRFQIQSLENRGFSALDRLSIQAVDASERTEQLFACHMGLARYLGIRRSSCDLLPGQVRTDARAWRNAALEPRPNLPEIGKHRRHQRRGEILRAARAAGAEPSRRSCAAPS